MAMDMFLKFEGGADIKGESKDEKNKESLNILAWSWGASQSGSMHYDGGGGAGKANIQDLSVTTWLDNSWTAMTLACIKGTHIDKATLTVRKAGDKPLDYLVIKMEEVLITSVSTGGSGGEDRLTANVTLNFAKVNAVYQKQKKDGSGEKGGEFTWDIPANANA